ncbi:MAG: FkbM family methyltransferase [Pseudomonadota bacterium]
MWSGRIRRLVQSRRSQRRALPPKPARRGPVDASDWMRLSLHGVEMTVAAPDPALRKFWTKAEAGLWEPETFAFLDRAIAAAGPAPLFVDVGVWIGPITLYAAGRGAKVLALEPDPAARLALVENLAANPALEERVMVVAGALDDRPEPLTLYPHSKRFGASKTSALPDPSGLGVRVGTLSAEAVIDRAARLSGRSGAVVKVDIEGHEFAIGGEIARLIRGLGASALVSTHPRSIHDAVQRRAPEALADQPAPHFAAYDAVRRLIKQFEAAGLDARALGRPDADALTVATAQLFGRGRKPKNFDLEIEARAAPDLILD